MSETLTKEERDSMRAGLADARNSIGYEWRYEVGQLLDTCDALEARAEEEERHRLVFHQKFCEVSSIRDSAVAERDEARRIAAEWRDSHAEYVGTSRIRLPWETL